MAAVRSASLPGTVIVAVPTDSGFDFREFEQGTPFCFDVHEEVENPDAKIIAVCINGCYYCNQGPWACAENALDAYRTEEGVTCRNDEDGVEVLYPPTDQTGCGQIPSTNGGGAQPASRGRNRRSSARPDAKRGRE